MVKLTDQLIRGLQATECAKDIQAFDDDLPGFGVRKFGSGKASLFVKYSIGTQQRRKTLGPWVPGALPAIRKEAAVVLAQARLGKDVVGRPTTRPRRRRRWANSWSPTSGCARSWKPLREKSHAEVTRYLEQHWQPLHAKPVGEITRQMVRDRRNELINESGAVAANRALAALSGLCGWAIEQEYIPGTSPTSDIKPLHEYGRERVLSEKSWWKSGLLPETTNSARSSSC